MLLLHQLPPHFCAGLIASVPRRKFIDDTVQLVSDLKLTHMILSLVLRFIPEFSPVKVSNDTAAY